ncbi:MAG: helicase HerA domain-containing protein [Gammaproteobacteria bacterium]
MLQGNFGSMARSLGNDLLIARDRSGRPLTLSPEELGMHLYVAGSTGSGKSKFIEYLLRQDVRNWRNSRSGVLLLDPHGSVYDGAVQWLAGKGQHLQPAGDLD